MNILDSVSAVSVTSEDVQVCDDLYQLTFQIKPMPFSTVKASLEAIETGEHSKLLKLIPDSDLHKYIVGWAGKTTKEDAEGNPVEINAFEDRDGHELECNAENLKTVIDGAPGLYMVLAQACVMGYFKASRKNLSSSPAGNTQGEQNSAKDAGQTAIEPE